MRRRIVAGNWKMHGTGAEAVALATEVRRALEGFSAVEVVLCPPFTALPAVAAVLAGGALRLGAQNVHWDDHGAFTGEIAPPMLAELGCDHVILGHSERRTLFHETDDGVKRKVGAALAAGLHPIVCVGETLEQREAGTTRNAVEAQLTGALAGLGPKLAEVLVAYEPVWAIGTGRNATAAQAQEVHAFIRALIERLAGPEAARTVPILYGGSVKPSNAAELFSRPDVDGGLIGGASLDVDAFVRIVRAAVRGPMAR